MQLRPFRIDEAGVDNPRLAGLSQVEQPHDLTHACATVAEARQRYWSVECRAVTSAGHETAGTGRRGLRFHHMRTDGQDLGAFKSNQLEPVISGFRRPQQRASPDEI
jgi:hypothetical protein